VPYRSQPTLTLSKKKKKKVHRIREEPILNGCRVFPENFVVVVAALKIFSDPTPVPAAKVSSIAPPKDTKSQTLLGVRKNIGARQAKTRARFCKYSLTITPLRISVLPHTAIQYKVP